jgi:predicted metal-dependent hydrolase
VPQRDEISGQQAWAEAERYLAANLPFHAHEVLEQRWRSCPFAERDAWRAAAQWGAAVTHAARGNDVGAQRLARRALATLESAEAVPSEIDVERITRECAALGP